MTRSTMARVTLGAALALTLAACGGGGDAEACDRLETELTDTMDGLSTAISDPESAQDALAEMASTMRDAAEGGSDELVSAVDDFASTIEEMGEAATTGGTPDMAGLTESAESLQEICG